MNYDWMAALAFFGALVVLTLVGRFLAFKVPALERMHELNDEADKVKLGRKPFRDAVKASNQTDLRETPLDSSR